ncbi:hypothetical protein BKA93DRAFT_779251 [Sparassis latifolia]
MSPCFHFVPFCSRTVPHDGEMSPRMVARCWSHRASFFLHSHTSCPISTDAATIKDVIGHVFRSLAFRPKVGLGDSPEFFLRPNAHGLSTKLITPVHVCVGSSGSADTATAGSRDRQNRARSFNIPPLRVPYAWSYSKRVKRSCRLVPLRQISHSAECACVLIACGIQFALGDSYTVQLAILQG